MVLSFSYPTSPSTMGFHLPPPPSSHLQPLCALCYTSCLPQFNHFLPPNLSHEDLMANYHYRSYHLHHHHLHSQPLRPPPQPPPSHDFYTFSSLYQTSTQIYQQPPTYPQKSKTYPPSPRQEFPFPDGKKYYYNSDTKEYTCTPPPLPLVGHPQVTDLPPARDLFAEIKELSLKLNENTAVKPKTEKTRPQTATPPLSKITVAPWDSLPPPCTPPWKPPSCLPKDTRTVKDEERSVSLSVPPGKQSTPNATAPAPRDAAPPPSRLATPTESPPVMVGSMVCVSLKGTKQQRSPHREDLAVEREAERIGFEVKREEAKTEEEQHGEEQSKPFRESTKRSWPSIKSIICVQPNPLIILCHVDTSRAPKGPRGAPKMQEARAFSFVPIFSYFASPRYYMPPACLNIGNDGLPDPMDHSSQPFCLFFNLEGKVNFEGVDNDRRLIIIKIKIIIRSIWRKGI